MSAATTIEIELTASELKLLRSIAIAVGMEVEEWARLVLLSAAEGDE